MALKFKKDCNSLCVVVPAYNEERGIENCVKKIIERLDNLPNTHLLVVNDGSHDQTLKILKFIQTKYHSKYSFFSHSHNQGYGSALSTGAEWANKMGFSHVLYMDSDLTNHPKDINKFYKYMNIDNIDCVKASRFIKGGGMVGVSMKRKLFSIFGNVIARNCFRLNISDCTNGFRMVKTSFLCKIKLSSTGFSSIVEELYYLKTMRAVFAEVPVILTSRKQSNTNFVYSLKTIVNYGKFALKALFV